MNNPTRFSVSFFYEPDQLKGSADIEVLLEDGQTVYLARRIRFDNSGEEIANASLVYEEELRIKPLLQEATGQTGESGQGEEPDPMEEPGQVEESGQIGETGRILWVDADTEESSELAALVGAEIEKVQRSSGPK